MFPGDNNPNRTRAPSLIGDRAKILIMGGVLGFILILYFYPQPDATTKNPVIRRPPKVDASLYAPDRQILAEIRDSTAMERGGGLKISVWEHLLRKSYNIGPAAAAALHLSRQPADIARLRAQRESLRGNYIWVKGKLEAFVQQKLHPIPRAKSYRGRLRTPSGDPVIFIVSKPLPQSVIEAKDKWVRVEGFFVKIADKHYIDEPDVLNAPLLIGPRVDQAYPDWKAVDKIDPTVIGRVKNAEWVPHNEVWIDDDDMRTLLVDSQHVPLWHMASFAMKEFARIKDTDEHHAEVFELKDQYTDFRLGNYAQGAPLRLRGTFIFARVFRANTNPAGIEYWTEVWIRIARLGAKLIPIWVPANIGDWKRDDNLDIDGFFFKNYAYRVEGAPDMHTPLFVAGGLKRFKMRSHPVTIWVGVGFAVCVAFIALLFFNMNRKSRVESEAYKAKLIDRRRQRRSSVPGTIQN